MRAGAIVVVGVTLRDTLKMCLAEYDEVVEAIEPISRSA
jgi:hypothetical protein